MSLSRAQILAEIATSLPDNSSAAITPAILRTTMSDVCSTVLAGGIVVVDGALGSDSTGAVHDLALPFKTLNAALTASASGDTILVRPGTYTPVGNLAKTGVAWYFQAGAIINYAPASPSAALWDLVANGTTTIEVDGLAEFNIAVTGSPSAGVMSLVNAGCADVATTVSLTKQGLFRCQSITDTTGLCPAVSYSYAFVSSISNLNFFFDVNDLAASINMHGAIARIRRWRMQYGPLNGINCTVSGTTVVDFYWDLTGTPAKGLVVGDSLTIGNFQNGTLQAHACTINILHTNPNNGQLCQVWVSQGPTTIRGNLRTYNGPGQAAPLIIQSTDPVIFEGTIEMYDCDYSFPVDFKTTGAILKIDRGCLIQNLTGTGAVRNAIYGTTTPYGMFCEAGVAATVTYRNPVLSTAVLSSGFTSVGPAITVNAAVT